ncbi:MAG: LysR family transcriptional regulator [Pseudomonadota bacterium]|nr:LysR family transcriptional regulator [Pseudomonadota bacterium]
MRADFNDLALFAAVADHEGFAAAGRALGVPKSRLSRRVAELEARLGVRLIERSSRRFRVTDLGRLVHERARAMRREAEEAEALVAEARAEPAGLIRFGCPTGLIEVTAPAIAGFLALHPQVRLQVVAGDRPLDLIGERIDLALRVREELTGDASLTMRSLGVSHRILVASPALATGLRDVAQLEEWPLLSTDDAAEAVDWSLETEAGERRTVRAPARLGCADFAATRRAAMAGLGVALLPDHVCRDALAEGALTRALPDWRGRAGLVHLVLPTRRGLPPAVRLFIDHLARRFPSEALSRRGR